MNLFKLSKIAAVNMFLAPFAAQAQAQTPAPAAAGVMSEADAANYQIGPGDELQIFVWKNPDLSVTVPVRPDGKISVPLVADMQAQGKTPTGLAAPGSAASIRVIGAAATPKSVPYRAGLTALDVIIAVGGLTTYADGNEAKLIRNQGGASRTIPLHLADLVKAGDLKANVQLMPGDIISIPQRWF